MNVETMKTEAADFTLAIGTSAKSFIIVITSVQSTLRVRVVLLNFILFCYNTSSIIILRKNTKTLEEFLEARSSFESGIAISFHESVYLTH